MGVPMKVSDTRLFEAFDRYGSITATANNLPIDYKSVYKRLKRHGKIRGSFINAFTKETSRVLPEGSALFIPDTQAPAHHPDAIEFLCRLRDKLKPKHVVCIGDEVDFSWMSDFAKLVEQDQPLAEYEAAVNFMRELSSEFDAISLVSNHVHGRLEKARLRARVPAALFKSIEEILDVPVRWSWHSEIRIGDVITRHGHKDILNLKRTILEEIPARYGRHYSIIIGHYHSRIGQATPDIQVGSSFYWGGFTGCLVNPRHPFFNYSKGAERLGTVALLDGRLRPFSMPVDGAGRWTGEIV
jgi:predicted MPP superfamily phosphohydrolase